ncbi:MAG TPA: NADP-dependent oxidoreductase [Burkholderiales bacterium]|nr:NADP-dependent oxidoreductase [Burkholderiales bacterium]
MRALVFKRYGGLDQVAFADIPRPVPKPNEILIQVHAAGLNPVENKIRSGKMKAILRFQLPATLGSDLAGVVVEVGGSVTRFKPGDAVFASIHGLRMGALAEFAVVAENAAALKPAHLDFVQAASMPMVALTAWQTLKERAHIKPGHKVFIPAGAGGIGTFAIQLAKYLGAKVATTTSAGNVDLVRSLGADEVIDYQKQKFEDVLRDYDAVLDTLGGESLEKSFQILRQGSIVVSIVGPPDAAFGRTRGMNFLMVFALWLLSYKMHRLAKKRGVEYSFLLVNPDGSQLAEIGELLKVRNIRPVIDKVFPFDQAKEALAYLEMGRAKGKVVVQMK